MSSYVMLINVNQAGTGSVGSWADELKGAIEALDGTMTALVTLGKYDIVAMVEGPSDETSETDFDEFMVWLVAKAEAGGDVSIEAHRAYTSQEWQIHTQTVYETRGHPYNK